MWYDMNHIRRKWASWNSGSENPPKNVWIWSRGDLTSSRCCKIWQKSVPFLNAKTQPPYSCWWNCLNLIIFDLHSFPQRSVIRMLDISFIYPHLIRSNSSNKKNISIFQQSFFHGEKPKKLLEPSNLKCKHPFQQTCKMFQDFASVEFECFVSCVFFWGGICQRYM